MVASFRSHLVSKTVCLWTPNRTCRKERSKDSYVYYLAYGFTGYVSLFGAKSEQWLFAACCAQSLTFVFIYAFLSISRKVLISNIAYRNRLVSWYRMIREYFCYSLSFGLSSFHHSITTEALDVIDVVNSHCALRHIVQKSVNDGSHRTVKLCALKCLPASLSDNHDLKLILPVQNSPLVSVATDRGRGLGPSRAICVRDSGRRQRASQMAPRDPRVTTGPAHA